MDLVGHVEVADHVVTHAQRYPEKWRIRREADRPFPVVDHLVIDNAQRAGAGVNQLARVDDDQSQDFPQPKFPGNANRIQQPRGRLLVSRQGYHHLVRRPRTPRIEPLHIVCDR